MLFLHLRRTVPTVPVSGSGLVSTPTVLKISKKTLQSKQRMTILKDFSLFDFSFEGYLSEITSKEILRLFPSETNFKRCNILLEGHFARKVVRHPLIGNGPNTVSESTVFWGSLSSGERTQPVPLGLLLVCQSELTEFFAELTEFAAELIEAQ